MNKQKNSCTGNEHLSEMSEIQMEKVTGGGMADIQKTGQKPKKTESAVRNCVMETPEIPIKP